MFSDSLIVILGALAAGLFGHTPTRWLMNYLWEQFYRIEGAEESLGTKSVFEQTRLFSTILGIIERVIYAGSWLIESPEAIAILLAIKAAPALREWGENKMIGRAQFNIWLIGTLFSLISSVLIAEGVNLVSWNPLITWSLILLLFLSIIVVVAQTAKKIEGKRKDLIVRAEKR